MNSVYIKTDELSSWLKEKYFKDKDLVTIDELLDAFENVADELDWLQNEFDDFKREISENYTFKPEQYT